MLTHFSCRLDETFTLNELCDVLILSTRWEFPRIREYACKHIDKHTLPPLDKIALANLADVPEWLVEPQVRLARRLAPLSEEEGISLGPNTVLRITRARELISRFRLGHTSGSRPSTILGKASWTHSGCWKVLCDAWTLILTMDKYSAYEFPEDAIMIALGHLKEPLLWDKTKKNPLEYASHFGTREGKFEPKKLCRDCDKEELVVAWVKKQEDCAVEDIWKHVIWIVPPRRTTS